MAYVGVGLFVGRGPSRRGYCSSHETMSMSDEGSSVSATPLRNAAMSWVCPRSLFSCHFLKCFELFPTHVRTANSAQGVAGSTCRRPDLSK